jgi:hypothetical protein
MVAAYGLEIVFNVLTVVPSPPPYVDLVRLEWVSESASAEVSSSLLIDFNM